MKKPFDIKYRPEIESGKYKVQTTDGRDVRIICWDKHIYGGRIELVALVPTSEGSTETCQMYNPDGSLIASTLNEKYKLVILTDEPELDEFTQNIRRLITEKLTTKQKLGDGIEVSSTVFIDDDTAKDIANGVLALARKQIEKEKPLFQQIAETGIPVLDLKQEPIPDGIAKCIQDHWWEMLDSNPSDTKAEHKRTPSPALTRIVESLSPEKLEQTKKEMLEDSAHLGESVTCDGYNPTGVKYEHKTTEQMAKECLADNSKTLQESSTQTEPSDDSGHFDDLFDDYYDKNWKDGMSLEQCAKHFYNLGKAEALKDLPKWKKTNVRGTGLWQLSWLPLSVYNEGYRIELSDLEKLPKED